MNQQRRKLVKAAVALGVVSTTTAVYILNQSGSDDMLLSEVLKGVFIPESFDQLRAKYPQAEKQLMTQFNTEALPEEEFLSKLKSQISKDYKDENWLYVNQWMISQTECLLAAAVIQLIGVSKMNAGEQSFENAPFEAFLKVNKWGPQETYKGVKFNEQPDGHCGIWANIENMPDGMRVFIGGRERHIFPSEKGFTSGVYDEVEAFINNVGQSEIVVYDEIKHRKQIIGTFTVLPPFTFYEHPNGTTSKVFGPIEKWGPQKAVIGEVFTQQPNGYAAFWFRLNSMSNHVQMLFNNETFLATVSKGLITSSFPPQYLPTKPGKYSVQLKDTETNEQLLVGEIELMIQK